MNQQIVDYLQKNKEAYSTESLVQQLKNAGNAERDIQEAVNIVYGTEVSQQSVAPQPIQPIITPTKKTSPWVWTIGGCLTLALLGFITLAIIGCLGYQKVKSGLQTQPGLQPSAFQEHPTPVGNPTPGGQSTPTGQSTPSGQSTPTGQSIPTGQSTPTGQAAPEVQPFK